jgi:hypothetical protein
VASTQIRIKFEYDTCVTHDWQNKSTFYRMVMYNIKCNTCMELNIKRPNIIYHSKMGSVYCIHIPINVCGIPIVPTNEIKRKTNGKYI